MTKLNPSGSALVYSTYLGGAVGGAPRPDVPDDLGRDIAVDVGGNAYVTGGTRTTDFPTTPDAIDPTYSDGSAGGDFFCENGHCDGFVVTLDAAGSSALYSSYLGGTGDDDIGGIAVDAAANVYVTGPTNSTDFATTPGAFQGSPAGDFDGFVVKIGEPSVLPPDCSAAAPSRSELWPANHKMVSVSISVPDPNNEAVTVVITGITQDEPTSGIGNGDKPVDGAGVHTSEAQLRAERDASGDGRVYIVEFTATNSSGGRCEGSVVVGVPHDSRPGHVVVDSGERYDSTN